MRDESDCECSGVAERACSDSSLIPPPSSLTPLRLALFTDTLGDVNGVARFVTDLARAARASGRDLTVFTSTRVPVEPAPNIVNVAPRAARAMPGYSHLQIAWPPSALASAVRAFHPDAIHVSTPGPVGLVGRRLAQRLGIPALATHHTDFPAFARLLAPRGLRGPSASAARAYLRWFYRPFARVLARSEASRAALADLGVPDARVHILRPGIDLDRFSPRFRDHSIWRHHGLDPTTLKVLYVGRLSREKNLDVLAAAWPRASAALAHAGLAADLVLVGDGPHRSTLERALLPHRAVFLGYQHAEALSRLYASSDLFVMPSLTDTLGQSVMEAQASGLPAIVSDQGGPSTLVRDGETGVIVRSTPNEPHAQAWVGAVVHVLRDASTRTHLAQGAVRLAQPWRFNSSFADFWRMHLDTALNR